MTIFGIGKAVKVQSHEYNNLYSSPRKDNLAKSKNIRVSCRNEKLFMHVSRRL
jgi:hypothetical protein